MYFDKDRALISKNSGIYIPVKFVRAIYYNLKAGIDYTEASPMYRISREEAAYILTNFKE